MPISFHEELRHRGEPLVAYPDADLWKAVGGSDGVAALINDLYRRIEQDELLGVAFPHFNSDAATPFFIQWFGGSRGYSDDLAGGLLRRHQHRYISPKEAEAWLRCMRESLVARGLDAEQIVRPLARIAKAMIHSPETEPKELRRGCDAVQDVVQVQFETLLNDAAKGRMENVRQALEKDRTLASRRGMDNRTLAWVATYGNRPRILELTLKAGADCNSPACDPLHATMACDIVQMGTGVALTPLAIAKKWNLALVATLVEHGAIDDVFTAAWLGDLPALCGHVDRNPGLVNAIDPADDFQEVSLLCHAVCGGSLNAVKLLLEHGAEVQRHSGKLLTLAVVMNRVDLVKLLIEHGADVERTSFLGRLDDAERPVADLLIAHGKKVPAWMLPRACRPDVSTNELHRVTVLLDYGASLDDCGRYGLTALHYAVRGGKLPLIKLLLERGAKPDALDDDGLTPLLHLSKTRSKADPIPVMELLAASGANVDARDDAQGTLLMHFARQGKAEPVQWLLAHGADRSARNNRGKTAADFGRAHPAIVRLLTKSQIMHDRQIAAPDSTAVRVALWRAMHVQVDPPPHVLEDEIGLRLAAPDEGWRRRPDMDPKGTSLFRASILARSRFIEDLVVEQAGRGVSQYVILGAGLDTFAQRRPEIASGLRVFEVDQPGPQAWKQQRLSELGFGVPSYLRFVPVNFEAGDAWWEALAAAGFDAAQPAVVASAGVSMYLTRDAIAATLRQVAALAPRSTLAMTFLLPLELMAPEVRPGFQMAEKGARASGTPFISFLTATEILTLAREAGFKEVQHVSAAILTERYFAGRTDGLRPPNNSEELLLATA